MSSLDHILGQLDRPDCEHAWSREDVVAARAELKALRERAALADEAAVLLKVLLGYFGLPHFGEDVMCSEEQNARDITILLASYDAFAAKKTT